MNNNELFSDVPLLGEHYDQSNRQEVLDIVKALQAQEGVTDSADLTGGGVLQPQSLETQLALLTFQEKHLKFFKDIGVHKAFSTLEEYNVQDGYGTEGGFVGQMENPEEDDAAFQREFAVMKYIRTLWRVSDVLQQSRTVIDTEVINVQAAMMRALRVVEKQLFFGDKTIIPSSFDGIIPTIKTLASSDNVFDLRGETITEYDMKLGAEVIAANYGVPTKMYASLSTISTINNILDSSKQRIVQPQVGGSFDLGHTIKGMKTPYGDFGIESDIFINPESEGVPKIKDPSNPGSFTEGATSTKAPATPTFTLTPVASPVTGSLWAGTGSGGATAGTYYYRVAAVNQYGKSTAAAAQSATVVSGGSMTITITPGSGPYAPTGYIIYRGTGPSLTGANIVKMVEVAKGTGATTTHSDKNEDLPGTSQSVLLDMTATGEMRTVSLAQLAPMHKVEYARIGPYRWGTVNFYCVPKYYAPNRYILFKNIGVSKLVRNQVIDL
jgi:hypothetical protein